MHKSDVPRRYGYVERIRQGGEFVAVLLDRVTGLLLKSLQARLAESASLRADLGFPDVFPVPVPDLHFKRTSFFPCKCCVLKLYSVRGRYVRMQAFLRVPHLAAMRHNLHTRYLQIRISLYGP